MPALRRLGYFVVVAEELNFQRAAARLNVTQPALWRQVRELERDVGVRLFARGRVGIELTQAGRVYLDDVRRIIAALDDARGRAQRVAGGQVGKLHIAFNEIAARARCLPRFFQAFRTRYPAVELQLSVMMSQRQMEALDRGEIDAGFLFHRPATAATLDHRHILSDDHVIALPRDHRLSPAPRIRLSDLADEPLIMPSPLLNKALHDRVMSACLAGGLVPNIIQHADNENTLLNMVAAGLGVAFVNTSCQGRNAREVMFRQVADFSVPVQLDLVWQRAAVSPPLLHFISLVEGMASEPMPMPVASMQRAATIDGERRAGHIG